MNSSGSDEKYDSECAQQFSTYFGTTYPFKSDCIKCMKFLKNLDDCPELDYQEQGIIYLYLWLQYYESRNKINNDNTLENMKKLMDSFVTLHNNNTNIDNTYNIHMKGILNDKLNDLFSLYEKFNYLQINQECTKNKCKCAQECVDTYKKSLEKCDTYSNIYLCRELENFRIKYEKHKPSATDCPELDSYLSSYKDYSAYVIILISFITISVLSSLLFILYKVITIFIYFFLYNNF
ncbi:hypothetical protein PVNG_05549 [Plasmodium vivax North Korean]|uniref:Variable surface protein n=1 Tax=Plasmodium vivax North Korean TaxID=1035514 RepID=A0A0J9U2Z9_PLAVI|nr:hypothetical protein PVNG_05549 [Plasmodium vivax North Korean]